MKSNPGSPSPEALLPDDFLVEIKQTADLGAALLDNLEQEYSHLRAWRVDEMAPLVDARGAMLTGIECSMNALLSHFGPADTSPGSRLQALEDYIAATSAGSGSGLREVWRNLAELIARLEAGHRRNSGMVFQGRQMMQRAIDSIAGEAEGHGLYSQSSNTASTRRGRLLGVA